MIESIEINNYRSITSCEISTTEIAGKKCFILLGKNEAGKSSILKAIALLNPDSAFDYNADCNKAAKKLHKEIFISYNLRRSYFDVLQKRLKETSIPLEIYENLKLEIFQYRISISPKNIAHRTLWVVVEEQNIFNEYVYQNLEKKFYTYTSLGISTPFLNEEDLVNELGEGFQFVDDRLIEGIIESTFNKEMVSVLPECVYWENTNNYLINNEIDLNLFAEDTSISQPLLNIFNIGGVKNIKERINLIKNDYEERAQLKDELSKNITHHINGIWPEHKINIKIEIEGTICTVMVEDQDDSMPKYKMEQRSDGFKQFISILLNLSSKSLTERIILMDEPEVHLHPSGAKFLRDELLRIAETNIVIISTHSIYMVDKLNLERHIKVSKDKSVTTLKKVNKHNPYEEEVIYEALGTSIYEHIFPNMVLFEGKTDKDLFDAFTLKFKTDIKPVNIGSISTDGVEKMPQYIKFIDGRFVKGFLVVDSDLDGQKIKTLLLKEDNSVSKANIFEINDISYTKPYATLEDLYPKEIIIELVNRHYKNIVALDETPFVKQLNEKNKELEGKINTKELKGFLAEFILDDLKKLTKEKTILKYPQLYKFYVQLHSQIKSSTKASSN